MDDSKKAGNTTPAADPKVDGEKKRRGRPPGSTNKAATATGTTKRGRPKKNSEGQMFVLCSPDPKECDPIIVDAPTVVSAIEGYASSHELKPEEVKVYELGKQVVVESKLTIKPV